ncbi:hypothetical protein GUJ93_ZPchr0009g1334 [Zizania palustris]|uniref:HMG-Y-related protein A n=1 Tax=Zizania palustris TaxID=103762 RepID=A0A8J5R2C1_ZIZPA|nr:hypothetical protein GUJ93_ZPchr0009g1334 [Zizania palustris]
MATDASIPPYPEMILAAIEALDDKNGSNKSAISQYIEEHQVDLPPAHSSLLTAHLARMKETGELVFSKNNYFRADNPDLPPKRGRGRPPKVRDPNAPAAAAPTRDPANPPRPRGRPPKPKGPAAEAVAKATSDTPRRPGRPPKKAKVTQETPIAAPAAAPTASEATSASVKRGRGRPPK